MIPKEKIMHTIGNEEAWTCLCGNTSSKKGFYPCNNRGEVIEPEAGIWSGLYLCDNCGRMINKKTLEIVGNAQTPATL